MSKDFGKKKTLTQLEKDVFGPKRSKVNTQKRTKVNKEHLLLNQLAKQNPKSRT